MSGTLLPPEEGRAQAQGLPTVEFGKRVSPLEAHGAVQPIL